MTDEYLNAAALMGRRWPKVPIWIATFAVALVLVEVLIGRDSPGGWDSPAWILTGHVGLAAISTLRARRVSEPVAAALSRQAAGGRVRALVYANSHQPLHLRIGAGAVALGPVWWPADAVTLVPPTWWRGLKLSTPAGTHRISLCPINDVAALAPATFHRHLVEQLQQALDMNRGRTPVPPEGWYADPANPARFRWWDGRSWAQHPA